MFIVMDEWSGEPCAQYHTREEAECEAVEANREWLQLNPSDPDSDCGAPFVVVEDEHA